MLWRMADKLFFSLNFFKPTTKLPASPVASGPHIKMRARLWGAADGGCALVCLAASCTTLAAGAIAFGAPDALGARTGASVRTKRHP